MTLPRLPLLISPVVNRRRERSRRIVSFLKILLTAVMDEHYIFTQLLCPNRQLLRSQCHKNAKHGTRGYWGEVAAHSAATSTRRMFLRVLVEQGVLTAPGTSSQGTSAGTPKSVLLERVPAGAPLCGTQPPRQARHAVLRSTSYQATASLQSFSLAKILCKDCSTTSPHARVIECRRPRSGRGGLAVYPPADLGLPQQISVPQLSVRTTTRINPVFPPAPSRHASQSVGITTTGGRGPIQFIQGHLRMSFLITDFFPLSPPKLTAKEKSAKKVVIRATRARGKGAGTASWLQAPASASPAAALGESPAPSGTSPPQVRSGQTPGKAPGGRLEQRCSPGCGPRRSGALIYSLPSPGKVTRPTGAAQQGLSGCSRSNPPPLIHRLPKGTRAAIPSGRSLILFTLGKLCNYRRYRERDQTNSRRGRLGPSLPA